MEPKFETSFTHTFHAGMSFKEALGPDNVAQSVLTLPTEYLHELVKADNRIPEGAAIVFRKLTVDIPSAREVTPHLAGKKTTFRCVINSPGFKADPSLHTESYCSGEPECKQNSLLATVVENATVHTCPTIEFETSTDLIRNMRHSSKYNDTDAVALLTTHSQTGTVLVPSKITDPITGEQTNFSIYTFLAENVSKIIDSSLTKENRAGLPYCPADHFLLSDQEIEVPEDVLRGCIELIDSQIVQTVINPITIHASAMVPEGRATTDYNSTGIYLAIPLTVVGEYYTF